MKIKSQKMDVTQACGPRAGMTSKHVEMMNSRSDLDRCQGCQYLNDSYCTGNTGTLKVEKLIEDLRECPLGRWGSKANRVVEHGVIRPNGELWRGFR